MATVQINVSVERKNGVGEWTAEARAKRTVVARTASDLEKCLEFVRARVQEVEPEAAFTVCLPYDEARAMYLGGPAPAMPATMKLSDFDATTLPKDPTPALAAEPITPAAAAGLDQV